MFSSIAKILENDTSDPLYNETRVKVRQVAGGHIIESIAVIFPNQPFLKEGDSIQFTHTVHGGSIHE